MAHFARDLGVAPGSLSNWMYGHERISAYIVEQIRELTGGAVVLRDWPWIYFFETGDEVDRREELANKKAETLEIVQDTLAATPMVLEDAKKAVEKALESLGSTRDNTVTTRRLARALTLAVAARAQINTALAALNKEMRKAGTTP